MNIYTGPGPFAEATVNALGSVSLELEPGFTLDFESAQPSAGVDKAGNDVLIGEVVAGAFGRDSTAAGETVTYIIENRVGLDEFFAPRLLNSSSSEVYTVVNSGVSALDFFPYNGAMPGAGLDCLCVMPPSMELYFIGYYSYDSPGYITANETSVRVFDTANDQEIAAPFVGPFALEAGSGDVLLEITD